MDDWSGVFRGVGGGRTSLRSEDLQEEEVWTMMKARESSYPISKTEDINSFYSPSSSSAWRSTAPPRSITKSNSGGGGHREFGRSAPVDIPEWSKILRRKSSKNLWDDEYDDGGDGGDTSHYVKDSRNVESDDDDDGGGAHGDGMVPPHEYLARRLEATRISSFSMCEGVGRTLKGRDLSKLRNAILTKTGFLE